MSNIIDFDQWKSNNVGYVVTFKDDAGDWQESCILGAPERDFLIALFKGKTFVEEVRL